MTMLVLMLGATVLTVVPASSATPVGVSAAASASALAAIAPVAAKPKPQRWKPPRGVVFNNPKGSARARVAIVARIRAAIAHTRKGDTIRFATYSFDRNEVANQLIRAHRRGVNVQIVANDNYISKAELRMQKVFGKNRTKRSFMVFCKGSCRSGPGGNLHIKIYSFSSSGAADNVIISSSANLSYGASFAQWNDAYTVYGDRKLFATWVKVFRQLKNDRRSTPRRIGYSSADRSVIFQRQLAGAAAAAADGSTEVRTARRGSSDPVVQRLGKVDCSAPKGYGVDGRTVLKFIVFAWYGKRGDNIAAKVVDLKRKGCRVQVIGSVLGESARIKLQRAGISVKAADWDFGKRPASGDPELEVYGPRCYSHYKFFTLNGAYDGKGLKAVWTGSENWSGISFSNDEVTLRLNGGPVYQRYTSRFDSMWNDPDATHKAGVEPTRRPCARS